MENSEEIVEYKKESEIIEEKPSKIEEPHTEKIESKIEETKTEIIKEVEKATNKKGISAINLLLILVAVVFVLFIFNYFVNKKDK